VCIRFGMVSADTDVEELLSLVVRTGTELDEQVNIFRTLTIQVMFGDRKRFFDYYVSCSFFFL